MASKETTVNKSDEFFQLVSSGSVDELKKILVYYVPEEISAIVNSVNSEGESLAKERVASGHQRRSLRDGCVLGKRIES